MNVNFCKDLSLKAKGLYLIIRNLLQNDWEVSITGIQDCCSDGKDSIRSAMNELEKKGYLKKEHLKDKNGFFYNWKYTLLK